LSYPTLQGHSPRPLIAGGIGIAAPSSSANLKGKIAEVAVCSYPALGSGTQLISSGNLAATVRNVE